MKQKDFEAMRDRIDKMTSIGETDFEKEVDHAVRKARKEAKEKTEKLQSKISDMWAGESHMYRTCLDHVLLSPGSIIWLSRGKGKARTKWGLVGLGSLDGGHVIRLFHANVMVVRDFNTMQTELPRWCANKDLRRLYGERLKAEMWLLNEALRLRKKLAGKGLFFTVKLAKELSERKYRRTKQKKRKKLAATWPHLRTGGPMHVGGTECG